MLTDIIIPAFSRFVNRIFQKNLIFPAKNPQISKNAQIRSEFFVHFARIGRDFSKKTREDFQITLQTVQVVL
jgi:hypothetical protein